MVIMLLVYTLINKRRKLLMQNCCFSFVLNFQLNEQFIHGIINLGVGEFEKKM